MVWLKYMYHMILVLYLFFWNNVYSENIVLKLNLKGYATVQKPVVEYIILGQFPEWIKIHHRAYL